MTTEQLYNELNYVNHSREKRLQYANLVMDNHELTLRLMEILFMVNDKLSCRAAWILEYVCNYNLKTIIPHLDFFTEHLHKVHMDSAVRPVAKICEIITVTYYSKNNSPIKIALIPMHKERIVATCFDYMINNQKVAAKAYGMTTLYLLGNDYNWIRPELKLILESDFHNQSAAFKARAKLLLKKMNKK